MEKISRLGSYRIDDELAHSNICTVYRAFEESLGRPVLIKKLHPQMAREDDIRIRFEREAQVCAQVKHENIVDIYGFQADPDETMLILEFVEGSSLGDLISTGEPIPWAPTLVMLYGVLKGLAFAHSKSVIHRDIKPDNILISTSGQAKISDFGLATLEDAPKLTRQGMIVGTPAYMPPEQITGKAIDHRSDLFSLGATFYEVLTGTSPFYADNFSEIMKKVLNAHPQKPSAIIPEIPPEFDQIILRLIEKQPTKRYATADQALQDVKKLADQTGVLLEPETIGDFLKIPDTTQTGVRKSSTSMPRPAPTKRLNLTLSTWILVAIGGLAIIAALLLPDAGYNLMLPAARISPQIYPVNIRQTTETGLQQPLDEYITGVDERPGVTSGSDVSIKNDVSRKQAISEEPISEGTGEEVIAAGSAVTETHPDYSSAEDVGIPLPGQLFISSDPNDPWATVIIDNEKIGDTPLTGSIELSAGVHQIVFVNDQFPAPVLETVIIEPGAEQRLNVNLWSYFAIFWIRSAKPWAEVFIDGISYGYTPLKKPIILPLGRHEVELWNPDYKPWQQTYNITRGDPAVEISVTLTPIQSSESK